MSSRKGGSGAEAEDVWVKLQRESSLSMSAADSSSAATGGTVHQQLIFLGDAGSGKSSLIQTFLKPTAMKEVKPTVALDYNFARKTSNANTASAGSGAQKCIAHFWEIGGDLTEPSLLEIPLNNMKGPSTTTTSSSSSSNRNNLANVTFVVVCDLSKPQNVLVSVLRAFSAIRETIAKRVAEVQASDVSKIKELRDKIAETYVQHPDANRVKVMEMSVLVVANKHDALRSLQSAEKKALFQSLRFVCHYFGAALWTMSCVASSESSSLRDSFRNILNAIAFNVTSGASLSLPIATYKPSCETNVDKGVCISRGQDSFENILLHANFAEDDSSSKVKYRLVSSEAEVGQFISDKGVKKDVWGRLTAHMSNLFGEPDPLPSLSLSQEEGKDIESEDQATEKENAFPEADVDDMRRVRDSALQRLIQENERRQDMINKMNARSPVN